MATMKGESYQKHWLQRIPIFEDGLVAPKIMYTIFSGSQSAICNYLPVFYEHTANYSKLQIGVLQTLPALCALVAPPFWGAIADKYQMHRRIHIFAIVFGGALLWSLQFYRNFSLMITMVVAANFFIGPCGSMLDHAILDLISKKGGEYGKQRLFGAVGYGIFAYLTGIFVESMGIASAFYIQFVLALISLLVLRSIPVVKHGLTHEDDIVEQDGKSTTTIQAAPSLIHGLSVLMHQKDVLVLLFVVFLLGLMFGVLSSFLTLNLYNLSGNNAQIIGIAIVCETFSELPAFFFSHKIIQKFGTVNVLLLAVAGYGLRISYCWYMTNPWGAIPFEFLHGVTFGLAWAAMTQYIYSSAPKGFEGTMMGILNGIHNGLGKGVGTMVGGYFYNNYDAKTMWMVTDIGVPLALAGVLIFACLKQNDEKMQDEEVLEAAQLLSPSNVYTSPANTGKKKAPPYEQLS
jgi:oligosaccharide:H+ symporter